MVEDHYKGKRGVYYQRALREVSEKGVFKGVIRALGIIQELEDLMDIHQRLLAKEKKDGQQRNG